MELVKYVELYANNPAIPEMVRAVQADSGRILVCRIVDMNVPDDAEAFFYAIKPSGSGVYNTAVISGNTVQVELTNQTLAESGKIMAQLGVKSDGKLVKTFSFPIWCEKNYSGDFPESSNESTYLEGILADMQAQVDEATEDAEDATKNANTAADNANDAADNANTAAANSISQQQLFEEWFEYIKGQLSEDAAGNLQLQCMELDERLSLLEYMTMQNDFSAPLATDDETTTLIIDDADYAILADWKYVEA